MARILVINPNSSVAVTEALAASLAPLRFAGGPDIATVRLEEGPPGIESQRDIESVVLPISRRIAADAADAYVIACFSDPGLALARESTPKPVLGVAESAYLAAIGLGRRFGILAISERAIPRHRRYLRALGLEDRLAGDLSIGTGVGGLEEVGPTRRRILEIGTRLRDDHGADTLVFGCVGMSPYRAEAEAALGLPIVDPGPVAVVRAIGCVALGLRPRDA